MLDPFGRDITYLRVSITDRCNLRCFYCASNAPFEPVPRCQLLSYEEILRVIACGTALDIRKVRITGGEPLVRSGAAAFLQQVASVPGVEQVALTTNGLLLSRYLEDIARARLASINVSLDTLKADRFAMMTGGAPREFADLLNGVERAIKMRLPVKLNVVLVRNVNEDEVADFARLTIEKPVQVRFIEFMPPGEWPSPGDPRLFTFREAIRAARSLGELLPVPSASTSVAAIYRYAGSVGTVGFIAPVSEPFCASCNKIRLTARGFLRSCLLSHEEVDTRPALRAKESDDSAILEALRMAIALKPRAQTRSRNFHMSDIGG